MTTLPVLLISSLFLFCNAKGDESKLNDVLFNGAYQFIDLTYHFDNDTIYWPDGRNFGFTKKTARNQEDGSWYAANDFEAAEHGGTHIDAPYHFAHDGQQVGEIPLEKLIIPLITVDISSQVNDDPNFVLHKEHLNYVLNDNMGKPCIIMFKFGWSKYFHDRKKYLGANLNDATLNFPGLSAEIAEWIVTAFKNVVGVGVDVASVDPGSSTDFPVHKILSKAGLYNIENANLHDTIPGDLHLITIFNGKMPSGTGKEQFVLI